MEQLSVSQRALVAALAEELAAIDGVQAVVLGGSFARGRARPDSDIDLGLLYSEVSPFSIDAVRRLAERVNDLRNPVVANFYEWGPWVNGGSWLTIGGQRVDFLYRCLEHLERTIADCQAGRYGHCYGQQAPFGYYSDTYLAEIETCIPLFDPEARFEVLKRAVAAYPEALRRALLRDALRSAQFDLYAARTAAANGDAYGTAACLTRIVNSLIQALFAVNRRYRVNDKTVLTELAEFEHAPREFGPRVNGVLSHLGATPNELTPAVAAIAELVSEAVALCDGLLATATFGDETRTA